jgi:leukotriene-A4 hydrolase
LEGIVGTKEFEAFMFKYIEHFQHKSITSEDFKQFFIKSFESTHPAIANIDWKTWFHGPGLPPFTPKFDTEFADASSALSSRWIEQSGSGCDGSEMKDWKAGQTVLFLDQLCQAEKALSVETLQKMAKLYAVLFFFFIYFFLVF